MPSEESILEESDKFCFGKVGSEVHIDLSTEMHNRLAGNKVWSFSRMLCAENSGLGGFRIKVAAE